MGCMTLLQSTGLICVLLTLCHISFVFSQENTTVVLESTPVIVMMDSTSIQSSEAEVTSISSTTMASSSTPETEMTSSSEIMSSSATPELSSPMPGIGDTIVTSSSIEGATSTLILPTSTQFVSSTTMTVPEIVCVSFPCKNGGNCTEEGSSFTCSCSSGWTDDTCQKDIDECRNTTLNDCSAFAFCNNTEGGYNCTCNPGYNGGGMVCDDIDECKDDLDNCAELSSCENTEGSYTCKCKPGYEGDPSSCTDINECLNATQNDCHEFADCMNNNGSYGCLCKPGYTGDGKICLDVDECKNETLNTCMAWASCNNTMGGYNCVCNPGYEGDGSTCSDIDECYNATLNDCHEFGDCINTNGSFICQCKEGYSGDGKKTCDRIDLCTSNTCQNGGICYNTVLGKLKCGCLSGWIGDYCERDLDECMSKPCDMDADCQNLNGSHSCTCKDGHHGDGMKCTEMLIYLDGQVNQEFKELGSVDTLYGPYELLGGQLSVYVHMNGYVVIGERFTAPYPAGMDTLASFPANIFAPFWTSIDTSEGVGKLVISSISDREELDVIKGALPSAANRLRAGVIATWHKVNPVPASSYQDKEVFTFQTVVVTDWVKTWVIFNYDIESLTWDPESDRNRIILVGTAKKDEKFMVLAKYPKEDGILSAYQIDTSPGNTVTNKTGRWVFDVESTGSPTIGQCQIWIADLNKTLISESIHASAPCPCTSDQAQSDLNYWYDATHHTATPWFGAKHTCIYNSEHFFLETGSPDGGFPDVDGINETEGRQLCCEDSSQCELFYDVFQSDDCSKYEPPVQAVSWGDPHIKTLNGTQYTFNGLGEFVHWKTDMFEIQCRTSRVFGSTKLNATEFSAFAMKDSSSDLVELRFNSATGGIDVAVNGVNEAAMTVGSPLRKNGVIIIRATDSQYRISFPTGINFMVSPGLSNLQLSVMVSPTLLNKDSSGLIAMTVDRKFKFRNGTLLPRNSSEADLFQFGMSWKTNATDSLFNYTLDGAVESFDSYNPTDVFIPPFYSDLSLEDMFDNNSTRELAKALCGSSRPCLVDYIATLNDTFANQTKVEQTMAEERTSKLDNYPPKFVNMPTQVRLIVGEETKIELKAEDSNPNDNITFIFSTSNLPSLAVETETDNNTYISLTPTYLVRNTSFKLQIVASDGRGGASVYWPTLMMCACRNKSECLPSTNSNINPQPDRFNVEMCDCQAGYEGDFCEMEYDICLRDQPCYPGVNCTSTPPGVFTCSPCPQGLKGDGRNCFDVNECLTVHDCEHICTNLPGGYNCSCNPGFELDSNIKNCTDIDECLSSPCAYGEFCENTEGSFHCNCIPGYFNRTGTCQKDLNVRQYHLTIRFQIPSQPWDEKLQDRTSKEFWTLAEKVVTSVSAFINITGFDELKVEAFRNGSIIAETVASYDKEISTPDLKQHVKSQLRGCVKNCLMGDLIIPSIENDFNLAVKDFCEGTNNDCDEISTQCKSTNGSFQCDCKKGFKKSTFYSNRCDDINECSVGTLCGEATCINTPGNFTCTCSDDNKDFKDNKCVDKCYNSPCQNDGICMVVQDTFACKCTDKWTGGTCEEAAPQSYRDTLIIVASVVGSVCLIAFIVIVVICCRRRSQSKTYSGIYESSVDEDSAGYQGWTGKISRPKRTQTDLEMVENGNRSAMDDPSKPLPLSNNKAVDGHDNPSFTGAATNGNNPSGRRSGNEYF